MSIITNPEGAYGQTPFPYSERVPFKNVSAGNGTILPGDVVVWVWDETTQVLGVNKSDAGTSDPAMIAGVAAERITVGDTGLICVFGYTLVNIGSGTGDAVAAAERAIPHATTDGAADGVAADATTVAGDTFGVFLGDEVGTTNQAPLWVCKG